MVCFHPIKAFYPLKTTSDGKRYLLFGRRRYLEQFTSHIPEPILKDLKSIYNGSNMYDDPINFPIYYDIDGNEKGYNIKVPCGKCIGCRLDYSRNWATRSVHEAFMYEHYKDCAFVTLTFNDDMLYRRSNPHSLNKTAFRSWIKRLRKAVYANYGKEFRIMCCGEYGAKHKRPHYHMLIYGFNFPDKKVFNYRRIHGKDVLYYRSPFLEDIWRPAYSSDSFGYSVLGEVTFESSAYVARYVTKKLFGAVAEKVYKDIEPEFLITSRRKGLGYNYLLQYYKNIFELGYVMLPNGHKAPIPRYYVNCLKDIDEDLYTKYRIDCQSKMYDNLFVDSLDESIERLKCREELKLMKLDILKRQYEITSQFLHNIH